jgi:hypothetical protein
VKTKFNKIALIVTVLLVSGNVSLFLAEATLGVLGISYPVFHTFDDERGKALLPGMKGWYRGEGEAYIEINSAGYRDRENSEEKEVGTYRIAVLGDSYVEARQVPLEHTFVRRLEDYLESCQSPLYEKIETLNFGQSDYGTTDELLTLRKDVWRYDPDMVLTAFFHGNDLINNFPDIWCQERGCSGALRPFYYFDQGVLTLDTSFRDLTPKFVVNRVLLSGVHNFRTLELVNQGLRVAENWRIQNNMVDAFQETGLTEFVYAPPRLPVHEKAWAITEGVLDLLYKEVVAHQAQFFLVMVTNPSQVDPVQRNLLKERLGVETLDYPEQRLIKFGERLGFPVLDLVHPFQEYADKNQVYPHGFSNTRMGSGHWNEKGHDLAAKLMAEKICRDLLPH